MCGIGVVSVWGWLVLYTGSVSVIAIMECVVCYGKVMN